MNDLANTTTIVNKVRAFALKAHGSQKYSNTDLPFSYHLDAVAAYTKKALRLNRALDVNLALSCAYLHDTIEDTKTTAKDIEVVFGKAIADGTTALSKDQSLRGLNSVLNIISQLTNQPTEVKIVKLADVCANLENVPVGWKAERIKNYIAKAEALNAIFGNLSSVLSETIHRKIYPWKHLLQETEK